MIHLKVCHVLLALWCMDMKSECTGKECSLGKCIRETDELLRNGRFITEHKIKPKDEERFEHPSVEPAPRIIKEYLKVQNLTKQQIWIRKRYQQFLFINGPAGAGKTILILGKMIELAKPKKIVVFISGPSPYYRKTLQNAVVTVNNDDVILEHSQLNTPDFDITQYVNMILDQTKQVDVVLVRCTRGETHNTGEVAINKLRKIITSVLKDHCHVVIYGVEVTDNSVSDDLFLSNIICDSDKIIQLAKPGPPKKIVVFMPGPTQYYRETLENATVTVKDYVILKYSGLDNPDFDSEQYVKKEILARPEQVILVKFTIPSAETITQRAANNLIDIITSVANSCHVFIEDAQVMCRYGRYYDDTLLTTLLTILAERTNAPTTTTVWVVCDVVQVGSAWLWGITYSRSVSKTDSSQCVETLSDNLRTTCDISNMTSLIRESYNAHTSRDDPLSPQEQNGHYIHGPKPIINIVYSDHKATITTIVNKEIDKLYDVDNDIKISLVGNTSKEIADSLTAIASERSASQIDCVFNSNDNTYSSEWHAAIVVDSLVKYVDYFDDYQKYREYEKYREYREWVSRMYLLLSRGRVYCCVILTADPPVQQDHHLLCKLESAGAARIIHRGL